MYTLFLLIMLHAMDSNIILFFDLFGTMIFAITGAVKGIRNRLDLLGVLFFAVTVGCGGGMLRDALIGSTPVAAFNDYRYFLVCIIAGLVCFIVAPVAIGRWAIIIYSDAVGLGVFTALGVAKAAEMGVSIVGQIMSGMFTAVGGGILRDVGKFFISLRRGYSSLSKRKGTLLTLSVKGLRVPPVRIVLGKARGDKKKVIGMFAYNIFVISILRLLCFCVK